MFSATVPGAAAQAADAQRVSKPARPATLRPHKPDYSPLSVARQPMGPSIYPGAAAAEDVSRGLLVSDAMHDVQLYTDVSESLPDLGRPVLNSVFFSQRHVVNDTPSVEEDIAKISEKIRLWRASRLQEKIKDYEHSKEMAKLEEGMEKRMKEREVAQRDCALRRITRILNSLIPAVEKAIVATKESASEALGAPRRETLLKQWKERNKIQEGILHDMRLAERHWLVDRQYQRNMEEREMLYSKHYFSFLEQKKEERVAFLRLCEAFYDEKILVGVTDDERVIRNRLEALEATARLDVVERLRKLIPLAEVFANDEGTTAGDAEGEEAAAGDKTPPAQAEAVELVGAAAACVMCGDGDRQQGEEEEKDKAEETNE